MLSTKSLVLLILSILFLGISIWNILFYERTSYTTSNQMFNYSNLENKKILIGFYCYKNQSLYINVFQVMLGLELGKINYPVKYIERFCFRGNYFNYTKISSIYELKLIDKPSIVVNFEEFDNNTCFTKIKRIDNVIFITLKMGKNLTIEQKKYCIAVLVYNLTMEYFANQKF